MPKRKRLKKNTGPKAKFSFKKHVLPPLIGLAVMGAVFGALNAGWIIAQTKYHFRHPVASAQTVNPSQNSVIKSPDPAAGPQITIPKIAVKAPIVFEPSYAEWKVQLALRQGVVHYGSTALPGQSGNMAIFGHSSGQAWAPGNYKFVFTLLNKLQPGDQVFIDYKGIRYVYDVTGSTVVEPTDLAVIDQTPYQQLTLITCTPVGTSQHRLIIHAKQISPDPAADSKPSQPTNPVTTYQLPGSAKASLWHYLFGWL